MKKIISAIMIITITLTLCPSFAAEGEVTYQYGKIIKSAIVTLGVDADVLQVKIAGTDGVETIYTSKGQIKINGQAYDIFDMGEDLIPLIPERAIAKFALNTDGILTAIVYEDALQTYSAVTYDTETKTFSGLDSATASLPVFYSYNDLNLPPYLDGNHKYDIEVYDYAINITDMTAIKEEQTIKFTNVFSGITPVFLQAIGLECEATIEDCIVKGQLYNSDGNLLSETETEGTRNPLEFYTLPNTDASYTLKFWLEDESGNTISPVYEKNCETKAASVLYGKIIKTAIVTSGVDSNVLQVKIADANGMETIYTCDSAVKLNNTIYQNAYDLQTAIENLQVEIGADKFVKFAIGNDRLSILKSSETDIAQDYVLYDCENNILNVDVSISKYTQSSLSGTVYVGVFDEYGNLKGIATEPFTLTDSFDIVIDVTIDKYSYCERDYVQTFVWGDNMIPLCNPY